MEHKFILKHVFPDDGGKDILITVATLAQGTPQAHAVKQTVSLFSNSQGKVLKELGAGPAVFSKVKARLDARNLLWHLESLGSHSSDIMESRMKPPSWQLLPEPLTHGSTSHLLEPGRGVERALQKKNLWYSRYTSG